MAGVKHAVPARPRCTEMRASRGMGAIAPSKMPKAKTITRKDDPNKVEMYAKGGMAKGLRTLRVPSAGKDKR